MNQAKRFKLALDMALKGLFFVPIFKKGGTYERL